MFAFSMRPAGGWKMTAVTFALAFVLGVIFLFNPQHGMQTLTIVLIGLFMFEGIASLVIGFGLRDVLPAWGWFVFSGLTALLLGLLIMSGWPGTASWTIGLLVGLLPANAEAGS